MTSQHPYCEEFIGAPHVYTIDVNVLSDVESVMKEILLKEVQSVHCLCHLLISQFYQVNRKLFHSSYDHFIYLFIYLLI